MRSAGKAMEGVEFADPRRRRATAFRTGEVGEIATRSMSNMVGYWKMDEATRATISDDNWLRTGDAGYIDADGYIYIQDRIKDMIISGGENIYPAEVENAVFGHPAVAEVAVIGVPDDKWGESVRAIVVKKPGAEVSADEIIAYARERIAAYKSPKVGGVHRRHAAQRLGQNPPAAVARALLGGQVAPGELMTRGSRLYSIMIMRK